MGIIFLILRLLLFVDFQFYHLVYFVAISQKLQQDVTIHAVSFESQLVVAQNLLVARQAANI